jgi:cell division protein FtsQ
MPKNENRHRRRRKNGFLLSLFVAAFLLFVLLLTSSLFFKVKDIVVEGVSAVNRGEVIELSGFSHGDNMLLINKTAAARALISRMPYVRAVRIKRDFPGTVVIIITETVPAAMAGYRGSFWIFDAYGSLLESASSVRADLPLVRGFALLDPVAGTRLYTGGDDDAKTEALLDLLQMMSKKGIIRDTGEINLSLLSNITFTYKGKYRVELGPPEGFLRKLEVMLMALEEGSVSEAGPGTFYLAEAENKRVRFVPN